jgi:hypothetical protein
VRRREQQVTQKFGFKRGKIVDFAAKPRVRSSSSPSSMLFYVLGNGKAVMYRVATEARVRGGAQSVSRPGCHGARPQSRRPDLPIRWRRPGTRWRRAIY